MRDNRALAIERALKRGGSKIIGVDLTGYGFDKIEEDIQRENEENPDDPVKWIVINQSHNVLSRDNDNEVLRREKNAQAGRDLGKKLGIVVIDVTQGGDSCVGKLYLDMNDLFMNKTGMQGTADLIVGISATKDMLDSGNGERGLSFPKDKISYQHRKIPVKLNGALSRIEDIL